MPKSKGGGGKRRKRAKSSSFSTSRRELVFAEDGQAYGYVTSSDGDGRFRLVCSDGVDRLGVVRGRMWKRSWVRHGDVVLACLRDYQDSKCDVVHVYTGDEVLRLISVSEIPAAMTAMYTGGEGGACGEDASGVVFDYDDLTGV